MTRVSAVIPVKDGERWLAELLDAVLREGADEVLVIDSGSRDRSVAIARSVAGVEVVEIPAADFGHGRTRNLGVERTSGELICFLTQDATPVPGWLEAFRSAFSLDARVGAAYGPHLPRADTSPMIARELEEFFASFSPDGGPVVQREGDPTFLSNVNACYARACWEEIRFREVAYAEDQAFGRELLASGWTKVYHPRAAVLHAHDYGALEFMRRYFDEYRGLRETIGHVEPFGVRLAAGDVRRLVAADRQWMIARGLPDRARAGWTARALVHHSGRKVFSALGSRAERLPGPVQIALSLEGRGEGPSDGAPGGAGTGGTGYPAQPADTTTFAGTARPGHPAQLAGTTTSARRPGSLSRRVRGRPAATAAKPGASGLPPTKLVRPKDSRHPYEIVARVLADGPRPLAEGEPDAPEREHLHIAMIIPAFRRGSGGHNLLFQILVRLERMGHTCSVWHVDPLHWQPETAAVIRGGIIEHFAPLRGPVFKGFDAWFGADVVMATSWITAYHALALDGCRSRVYLVNDHEPEFAPTSAESRFAAESYRFGMPVIAGSRWLRDVMEERYGARATDFTYGVDHDVYRPRPIPRRRDTIAFYARVTTPRRAVPLGLLALEALKRRRPDLRIVLFGDSHPPPTTFPCEHVGIATPEQLSYLYSEATAGLCLSLTNYSLVPKEMMACGLPVIDLRGVSAASIFPTGGPIELADPNPEALATAIQRLLDDPNLWTTRSAEGITRVADHTWDRAAQEVATAVRQAYATATPPSLTPLTS